MRRYLSAIAWLALSIPAVAHAARTHYVDGVSNPEDLIRLPGTRWVVVSCMRSALLAGALKTIDTRHPDRAMTIPWRLQARPAIQPASFAPHGMDVRRVGANRFALLVVDHGAGESIDRILIDTGGTRPSVVAAKRVFLPPHTWGNGVAWLPRGGFVATSMYDPQDTGMMRKMADGAPTGQIWRWGKARGWRPLGSMTFSGANGVAVSADGSAIYVSEWAARKVWKLHADGRAEASATTEFLPDNLHWDGGDLLLAGQIARPEAVLGCPPDRCARGFAIARLAPASLRIKPLWIETDRGPTAFAGGTGAIGIGNEIWVGSFMGSKIARRLSR